jgi:hypothetical protein
MLGINKKVYPLMMVLLDIKYVGSVVNNIAVQAEHNWGRGASH